MTSQQGLTGTLWIGSNGKLYRLIDCLNKRISAVGPRSRMIFGPQLCLARGQVDGVNERPFDLGQRIVFIRWIEVIDKVAGHFRDRCAIGGYAELPVRQAFRNR